MKKNRIISLGIDGRVLFRKNIRGMGRYLKNIVQRVPEDFEIVLYGEKENEKDFHINIPENVKIKTFDIKGYRFQLWEQLGLPFFMFINKHDIFFSPATTCPILHTSKLVVTVHDAHIWQVNDRNLLEFYYNKIAPLALKRADRIITISNFSKKEISSIFPYLTSKMEVIYHGIDKYFHPNYKFDNTLLPERLKFLKQPFLLYIGGESPKKQPDFAIKVFRELLSFNPNLNLVMVGISEKAFSRFNTLFKKLDLVNQVFLAPTLSDKILAMLYATAEAVLYPTLHEGFGFPILEAMACKTPILASNVASLPEISKNLAWLLPPKDLNSWVFNAKEVLELKSKSALNEKLEKALKYAQTFTWENTAQKTYNLFRELINEG